MSAAKHLKFSPALLCFLLLLLSGCSIKPVQIDATTIEDSSQPEPSTTDTQKSSQSDAKKENQQHTPDESNSQPLCVYETIKGIAEVTEIARDTVTFKFYPGDQYFNIPKNNIPYANIRLEQEIKAIARSPLSGPCESDEFELLTTIE
ncbi:hypothetical protein [Alkalimarinus sediminis]|uniref:DUF4907 domain-containing protein n=1 Tax=Alkalimarinus sediminis TaxID=1632866 RepID=A0A9E8KPZ8_9ALTE|nr:hypothetical protein [Alkalimarinus sediminis]UZW74690.1 hypothetical protein NNL22_16970 [Alkalimarinus sediminis]